MEMDQLEKRLGYTFRDKRLLETALTHSSYANESRGQKLSSNERLEFLGDSVLGMLTAEYLYRTRKDLPEGDLTRLRASLVCEQSLVEVARMLGLGEWLKLGHGEEAGGGRKRPSILADAVEAVLAAIYLDGGQEEARRVVESFLLNHASKARLHILDYKTLIQELVQRESGQTLAYVLVDETGPDHAKIFRTEVRLNGVPVGTGTGRSKKEAEQAAAREAYQHLSGT
jgi:ribonuclease-3